MEKILRGLLKKICHDFASTLNNLLFMFEQLDETDPLFTIVKKSTQKTRSLLEGYRFLCTDRLVSDAVVRTWIKHYMEAIECTCTLPYTSLEHGSLLIIGSLMVMGESAKPHQKICINIEDKLNFIGKGFKLRETDQHFLTTGEKPEDSPLLAYLAKKFRTPTYCQGNNLLQW